MAAHAVISVDEHLAAILAVVHPLAPLEVGLLDAHGCVLAEDLVATAPVPAHSIAAVDGYAVRTSDVAAAPVVLPVVGDVVAGTASPLTVQPGLTVRISAGALMPQGADAVVPRAWTDSGLAQVRIDRAQQPGGGVSAAGAEVAAGEVVLTAGTHLGAAQVGLAAGAGRARLQVRPRPRVVVLSTGPELVEPGVPLSPGQVHDSNSLALTTACLEAGAIAYRVGIVKDDGRSLLDTLEDQLVRADLIVLSAGVSPSSYDSVREVLSRLGKVAFSDVAMDPGSLHGFGTIGPDSTPVFGLPGDAVGAQVSFEAFVRPALRRMLGVATIARPMVSARAGGDLVSPAGRRSFLRASLEVKEGAYVVTPVPTSSNVSGLSRANALAVVPESVEHVAAGTPVQVVLLERDRPAGARHGWPVSLVEGRVGVRPLRLRDAAAWSESRIRNEEWLTRWEGYPPGLALGTWEERHGPAAFAAMLRVQRRESRAGRSLPFGVMYDGRLVGQVTVANVVRGAFQSATVGYWVDAEVAGRGVIPTALALVVDHCFTEVGLHRIEANVRPENGPSLAVVRKLGFREEGLHPRYLHIDGAWRDHLCFAVTVEDVPDGVLSRVRHTG